ncbi:alpha- and gamma-adaptin-binding protein p34-like isoform X1 [Rhopalosiphum padi]|uniref:alpha- and gamma-adaptin-binding protein p34-like isoform X1 n=1 Tax=Rhopalosiphum padi TaxID=40932 RepID=UPI00298E744B|nr:alpha- and gamma-adaptin-binding protein p34-like isoform X1 [Rhopalosiphum padi]
MSISELPCVYIYSCCDDDPLKIIKLLRNEENIEICNNEENILSNRWTIDCKYYTADINLCTSISLNKLSDQFVHNINAIIILFDIDNSNIMETINKCLPLVEKSQAEVLILLSEKNIDSHVSNNATNSKIFEWCRKNHFELIVLEEIADEMDTTGIERVKQALYAHHWPNLKAKCQITNPSTKSIIEDSVINSQLSGGLSDLKMDTEQEAELDSDLFTEMFEGDFNFFKTIDKVRKLKEQISAMPDEERKDAAEKTLTECWKAFFGDDVDL